MRVATGTKTELMANVAGNPNWDYAVRSVTAALLRENDLSPEGKLAVEKYMGELTALGVSSKKWEFDGTSTYATHTAWVPSGLPYDVGASFVPIVVDGVERRVLSGTVFGIYVSAAGTVNLTFLDTTLATQTIVGPVATAGDAYTALATCTSTGVVFTVNGTDYTSASIPASKAQNPISAVAALPTPANYLHGPVWNERLTDNSPIQDTDVLDGNGTRITTVPAYTASADPISIDLVYKDGTYTILDGAVPVITVVANVITAGANVTNLKMGGVTYAATNHADGQHITLTFDLASGTITTIGALPAGVSAQNLILGLNGIGYKIDEGTGTVITAYSIVAGEFGTATGLGAEGYENGAFADLSGWTFDNSDPTDVVTTLSGGGMNIARGAGGISNAPVPTTPTFSFVAGKRYVLTYDIVGGTGFSRVYMAFGRGTTTVSGAGAGSYSVLLEPSSSGAWQFAQLWTDTNADVTVDNLSIKETSDGTVTPDAAWTNIPDNSRFYPMNEGSGDTFLCSDGNGTRVPAKDATIQNYVDDVPWKRIGVAP